METGGQRHSFVRDSGIRANAGCPVGTTYLSLERERVKTGASAQLAAVSHSRPFHELDRISSPEQGEIDRPPARCS
jgi:hypothetical protein